ncbi:Uncharacterized protein FKW44_014159 [Caligus rogercresseyi]|uniref:Helicase with zinc finger domain n=1 Tax=Caligus rogercresseyi TaxID=217165 RepID=A0A7T8GYI4_CALRO|nr:Uncharacterized protein FKW44_014159 [Caligus rogercresseyi]
MASEGMCRAGAQCVEAHSKEELTEWKDRFDYRQKKAFKANKILGKTFVDNVIERLSNLSHPSLLLRESIEGISLSVDRDISQEISNNDKALEWNFTLQSSKILRHVALLSDENRIHFKISCVKHQGVSDNKEVLKTYSTDSSQEWAHPESNFFSSCRDMEYKIKINFSADFFGSFLQTIVFNFGSGSGDVLLLKRDLRVDVQPEETGEDESGVKEEEEAQFHDVLIRQPDRWDESNSHIIDFEPPLHVPSPETQRILSNKFRLSQNVTEPRLTKANYRGRMHELLFIEEMAQYEQVGQFNHCQIRSAWGTLWNDDSGIQFKRGHPCGTPYSHQLLTLLLSRSGHPERSERPLWPALRTPERTPSTSGYELKEDDFFKVEVQFQLNRLPICEMHLAVDLLPDLELVHPNNLEEVVIPWSTGKQWSDEFHGSLNPKQREAILAITASRSVIIPPILIIGPYGTGKTFTLGQSLKMLLKERSNRILVCTHSNSAADLYIKEYLHPYVSEINVKRQTEKEDESVTELTPAVKVLRVYYENRWVKTVHETVLKYCLVNTSEHSRSFRNPTYEEVVDVDIVVATLSTSKSLTGLGLPLGHFSHVLIDEAAQAMECEALMALALAGPDTRIVLAGDHMQLSPEVTSKLAREKNFNKSLLERLYDTYPRSTSFPCKILLCENYRSHGTIIELSSELFYEQKLLASGKQSTHDLWHPLTHFTARGEDVQDLNSTSFYNNAEVYEVVERVTQLQVTWPKSWGRRDETSIGIVTPYYDQVQRIRSELRKRNLFGVSVERVLNVQGKQFRAIFLSTVRTRKTCVNSQEDPEVDFGFLSNAKLLNTAISRAQSLVAVVGILWPFMWEKFMEKANKGNSFFGLTYQALRAMLDNVDYKKTYVLNPYAPVFVPRYAKHPNQQMGFNGGYSGVGQGLCRLNATFSGLFRSYIPPPPPWLGPPPPAAIPPPMMGWPPLTEKGRPLPSSNRPFSKLHRYDSPPPLLGRNARAKDVLFFNDGVHFPGKAPPPPPPSFRNLPPPPNSSSNHEEQLLLNFASHLFPEDIELPSFLKPPSSKTSFSTYKPTRAHPGPEQVPPYTEAAFLLAQSLPLRSTPLAGGQSSAILASDLEAQFHQQEEEDSSRAEAIGGGNNNSHDNFLLPSAKSTDTFFSLSNRSGSTRGDSHSLDPTNLILSEILSSANKEDLLFESSKPPESKVPLYMRRPGEDGERRRIEGGDSDFSNSSSSLVPSGLLHSELFFKDPSEGDKAGPLSYASALLRNPPDKLPSSLEEDPLHRIRRGLNNGSTTQELPSLQRENSFLGIGDFRLFDSKF